MSFFWGVIFINQKKFIRECILKSCVKTIIYAYNDIILSGCKFEDVPIEDKRRNQLVEIINKNRKKYSFNEIINTESGIIDEQLHTSGRIDICICYRPEAYTQECLSFECKRFSNKKRYTRRSVIDPFYNEGIYRYISERYFCDSGYGGMIAFCESGSYNDLQKAIFSLLVEKSNETHNWNSNYKHNWIYESSFTTNNNREIKIVSILMDFTN